jgi:hypothetical protein
MATLTLYRPVGSKELELIAQAGWKAFPPMPVGSAFYAYIQPPGDLRDWLPRIERHERARTWQEIEEASCERTEGDEQFVESWKAWGNSFEVAYVVWFEIEEFAMDRSLLRLDVDSVNRGLIGEIEVCVRYDSAGTWQSPRLSSGE